MNNFSATDIVNKYKNTPIVLTIYINKKEEVKVGQRIFLDIYRDIFTTKAFGPCIGTASSYQDIDGFILLFLTGECRYD